jgi:hypothetical protein
MRQAMTRIPPPPNGTTTMHGKANASTWDTDCAAERADLATQGDVAPPILVINGCPRSGTSLIETVLAKKFNAVIMPESHFIPVFRPFLFLWGRLKRIKARQSLIKAIYDFTEMRTYGTGLDVDEMRPYTLLATEPQCVDIAGKADTYQAIIAELYDAFRKLHQGSIAIEKTAYYHPVSWEVLASLMPNARFVHVIRDGRDVAASWIKTWFGPRDIAHAAWLWAEHVEAGLRWGEKHPERYLQVHYEQLTAAPDREMARIGRFIGLPSGPQEFEQSSLEWLKYISKNPHMLKIEQPIAAGNANKWETRFTDSEVAMFEAIAGPTLVRAGYSLKSSLPSSRAFRAARRRVTRARLLTWVTVVPWKRRLKDLLPLAIWLANRIGVSLPTLLRKAKLV